MMRRLLPCLLMAALVVAPSRTDQDDDPISGPDVLARMRAAYAGCTSYQGEGTFAVTMSQGDHPLALWSHGTFSTRFARGRAFHVTSRYAIGDGDEKLSSVMQSTSDRNRLVNFLDVKGGPKVYEYGSLEYMVEAATGATGLAASPSQYVASLLLPGEFAYMGLAGVKEVVAEAIEPVGGHFCIRLRGKTRQYDEFVIWVDKDTWMLRRLTREVTLEPTVEPDGSALRIRTTLEWKGEFDVAIEDSEFAFPWK